MLIGRSPQPNRVTAASSVCSLEMFTTLQGGNRMACDVQEVRHRSLNVFSCFIGLVTGLHSLDHVDCSSD